MAAATKLLVHLLIQNDFNYLLELAFDQQERETKMAGGAFYFGSSFIFWHMPHDKEK